MAAERDVSLRTRGEPTRDKLLPPRAEMFALNEIKQHFDESIESLSAQFDLAEDLISQGKQENACDIWRSQLVFLDGALDFYIHELSKYGILKMFNGEWEKTQKYQNLTMTMSTVETGLRSPESCQWLADYLDSALGKDTYMSFSTVKDQMNLLGLDLKEIADEAFCVQGSRDNTKDQMKDWLNRLFFRRNRIVHQSDRESRDAQRAPVERADVQAFVDQIQKIVEAIQNCAARKA